jgi:hypothetical protein
MLEAAGVEFIDENGGGPGVRLRNGGGPEGCASARRNDGDAAQK